MQLCVIYDPSHPAFKKVRLSPSIKSTVFFFLNRDRLSLRGTKCLNIIQSKFSLQTPRTVKDCHFVERLQHTLFPTRLLTPMHINHTILHIQLSPCG